METLKKYMQYAGLALLVAAALAALIWPYKKALPVILALAGLALVAVYIMLNLPDLKKGFRRRSFVYSSNLLLVVVLALGIVVLLNIVFSRFHHRFDFTEAKLHSLSEQSVQVVRSLKDGVMVRCFPDNAQMRDRMENQMKLYAYHTPSKLKYEIIDPYKNPRVLNYYKISERNTIILESGGRQSRVTSSDEQDLTNALIKVTRQRSKTVYFLEGHGEASLDDTEAGGYSAVKEELTKIGYEVKKLSLALPTTFPQDCDLLFVPGPRNDLQPEELRTIQKYIQAGGKAFFLCDPQSAPGLASFFGNFGLKLENDLVVDEVATLMGGGMYIPFIGSYETHEITKGFRYATFFPYVRSVDALPAKPEGLTVQVLAKTSGTSWAETRFDQEPVFNKGQDTAGPISVAAVAVVDVKPETGKEEKAPAAAAAPEKKEGRLAVFGSSNFVANRFVNRFPSNVNLFLNTVNWLTQESDLISILPKTPTPRALNLTPTQMRFVFYLALFILPLIFLVTGIVIWARRRSQ
ncbi:MAG: GldG family protein [Candidatus Aminicenantes bacterium]|nr:GldG family protein [Candidatus Aminicenantes bacterium]